MNRPKIATLMGAALVLAMAAAAMAQQVETTVDRTADFSKYRTFSIEIATPWGNPIGEKNMLAELTDAFTAKGWALDTQGSPNARILVHGATEEKQRLDTFYTGGYGGGYGGWGWGGVGSSTTTVSEFTQGTLVVDIFDAATKTLIWRGVAQDELKAKQTKREKQATKAVTKLLRDFPPKPAG
jgi:Domain of unknown function (DUF4136)